MSISYNKSIPVVFLVQEGDELPREATEEDFRKAGYVPASDESPKRDPYWLQVEKQGAEAEAADCAASAEQVAEFEKECKVEGCTFPTKDHVHIDLNSPIPEEVEALYQHVLKTGVPEPLRNLAEKLRRGDFKIFNLSNIPADAANDLYDPLRAPNESKEEVKPSPVEDFAGDLFKGAFSVFNTVKSGLADLLEPIDYTESDKPKSATEPTAAPEAKEEPEFDDFESSVIEQFSHLGLGKEAAAAMRKSKEFSEFLRSSNPSVEDAAKFAEMLRNGKDNFFGK